MMDNYMTTNRDQKNLCKSQNVYNIPDFIMEK